jgi:phage shock protein PspC (stress-responsive transcriptional regulator)
MKKLYRSKTDKKIAGVCGGLGAYFNIDPTIIRIIFVILLLPGGLPGLLPYLILWVVVPQEP